MQLEVLWDGVSDLTEVGHWIHPTSDVNGDGIGDYWTYDVLLPGPLLGAAPSRSDAVAELDMFEGYVAVAGFDADGDGVDDLLTSKAILQYGPFTGVLPRVEQSEIGLADYSSFRGSAYTRSWSPRFLRGHFDGRDGIVLDQGQEQDAYVYVLQQPRGTHLAEEDAEAQVFTASKTWFGFGPALLDAGDVDGDGLRDAIVHLSSEVVVVKGPLQGTVFDADDLPHVVSIDGFRGEIRFAIPDLNGDGVSELAGRVWTGSQPKYGETTDGGWWTMVFMSPHAEPLSLDDALPIGGENTDAVPASSFGEHVLDLDGDGLSDVVLKSEDRTAILVWWGSDLLSAWQDASR